MIKKSLHLCTCMGTASTKKVATPRKAFLVLGNSDDSCRRPSVMYGFQALLTSRRNHILERGNTQIADIWTCILHSTIHSTAEVDTQSHLNVDATERMGKVGKRAGRQRTWSDRQGCSSARQRSTRTLSQQRPNSVNRLNTHKISTLSRLFPLHKSVVVLSLEADNYIHSTLRF